MMKPMVSRKPFMLLLSILVLLSFLFLYLQPTLASLLNAPYRQTKIQNFIENVRSTQAIDGLEFWETREFYSPGSFKYSHDGFSNQDIAPILKELNVTMKPDVDRIPFLMYRSDKWISADFLVNSSTIADHVTKKQSNNKQLDNKIVMNTSTEWVYYEDENTLVIIFTKNIEEMQKSNGYFDYPGHDKEYLKDKYWLSISKVSL